MTRLGEWWANRQAIKAAERKADAEYCRWKAARSREAMRIRREEELRAAEKRLGLSK